MIFRKLLGIFRTKSYLLLGFVLLLGLFLRLLVLIKSGGFWFDEIVSFKISQKGILESWNYLKYENNPPLHFFLLHFWQKIWGFNEISARSLSFLFSALSIFGIYVLAKQLFNSRVAIISAAIFSVSPFVLFLSIQARPYAQTFLFLILTSYFFLKSISPKSNRLYTLGYFLFLTLSFYSHLSTLVIIPVHLLYLFLNRKEVLNIKNIVWAMFFSLLLFSPWFLNFIFQKYLMYHEGFLERGWYFGLTNVPVFLTIPFIFITNYSFGLLDLKVQTLVFVAVFAIVIYFIKFLNGKEVFSNKNLFFVTLNFIVPLFISSLTFNTNVDRYYVLSAVFLYILVAFFLEFFFFNVIKIDILLKNPKNKFIGLAFFLLFTISSFFCLNIIYKSSLINGSWRDMASYIKNNKIDFVLGNADSWVIENYLKDWQGRSLYYLPLAGSKFNGDMLEYVTRYNWISIPSSLDFTYIGKQIDEANMIAPENKKILYVGLTGTASNFIFDYLYSAGYQCSYVFKNDSYMDQAFVVVFEKEKSSKASELNANCSSSFYVAYFR